MLTNISPSKKREHSEVLNLPRHVKSSKSDKMLSQAFDRLLRIKTKEINAWARKL